jgi:tetratricopeptide (TPR) repeat protein
LLLKADILEHTKRKIEARALIFSGVNLIDDPEQKAIMLFKLGEMYESEKSLFDAIVAFERVIQFDPHNKSARFRSAYLCAGIDGLKLLGLRQYRILRNQDEKYGSTVNNLGILYGELGHDISKIKLFKIAVEQKEEWGYGNLIIAFLEAGFMDEAEELIISVPDSIKREERFVYAQSLFNERKRAEDEAIKILIENAEIIYQNVHEFLANFDTVTSEIFGTWTSNTIGYELLVEKSGEFIKIEQIDPVYRRWGIVNEFQHLSAFSIQQERKVKSPQTLGIFSLGMDGPSPAGNFILCRAGEKLRLLHVKDQKLNQRIEYTKKNNPPPSNEKSS